MQKILTTKKQLEFLAVNSDFFWYLCYCVCYNLILLFLIPATLVVKSLQKQKPRRKDCIQATGFLNKERNFDGESVLCTEEMLFPHLLYIVYQIFRRLQIFIGFFWTTKKQESLVGFLVVLYQLFLIVTMFPQSESSAEKSGFEDIAIL